MLTLCGSVACVIILLTTCCSEDENQWIVDNLLPSGMDGDAWLGLAELRRDNRFSWTDNSKVSFIKWAEGQPKTNKGSMECVAMSIGKFCYLTQHREVS